MRATSFGPNSSAPSASCSRSAPARADQRPARADQRDDVLALRQHPRDRGLRDGRPARLGHRVQRLDEREVVVEVRAGEARAERPEVGGRAPITRLQQDRGRYS
jgi:hypothetical protein